MKCETIKTVSLLFYDAVNIDTLSTDSPMWRRFILVYFPLSYNILWFSFVNLTFCLVCNFPFTSTQMLRFNPQVAVAKWMFEATYSPGCQVSIFLVFPIFKNEQPPLQQPEGMYANNDFPAGSLAITAHLLHPFNRIGSCFLTDQTSLHDTSETGFITFGSLR